MGIGEKFNRLTDCANDYAKLKMEEVKLLCVENLSIIMSDILSILLVFFIFSVSLFFALIAIVTVIGEYIGFLNSLLLVAVLLAMIAFIVFMLRKQLFSNIFVERFCNIFFKKRDKDGEC